MLVTETDNLSHDMLQISSMSSASSSGSMYDQSQYSQISEIKSNIDLHVFPQSLKKYRMKFILAILMTFVLCLALMIVNINAEKTFIDDLNIIRTQKLIRTKFTNSNMATVFAYGFANVPDFIQRDEAYADISFPDVTNFFLGRLNTFENELH